MNQGYQAEMFCEVFGSACEQFESLIFELYSERTAQMEHGEIETLISLMGTELLRRLMQASLDLRARREPRRHDLSGPDGNLLTHCRENCERKLATIFGDVTVKRKGSSTLGVESQFPLDGELNLAKDKYSHGLRCRVGEEAALHSFDEDEALRRDPDKKRPWAVLLDGAEKQLDLVLALIHRHRPDVTLVLDFIHVLEYICKAAYSFYAVGSKEAEDWVAQRALKILQGQAAAVATGMRQSATVHQLSSDKRKAVDKCADYLEKYDVLLDYDDFLSQGLPIATGVIEGACRHLIKDRMDLTGARWRLKSAEAVLRIRSLRSSGDFESYWTFHQARERERNHSSSYAVACAA